MVMVPTTQNKPFKFKQSVIDPVSKELYKPEDTLRGKIRIVITPK